MFCHCRVCDKDTPTQSYQDGEFDDGKITLGLKGFLQILSVTKLEEETHRRPNPLYQMDQRA